MGVQFLAGNSICVLHDTAGCDTPCHTRRRHACCYADPSTASNAWVLHKHDVTSILRRCLCRPCPTCWHPHVLPCDYDSREEVKQALLTVAHLPIGSDLHFLTKFRNKRYMDGGIRCAHILTCLQRRHACHDQRPCSMIGALPRWGQSIV